MAYPWAHIFGDLGVQAKIGTVTIDTYEELRGYLPEIATQINDTAEDAEFAGIYTTSANSAASAIKNTNTSLYQRMQTYLKTIMLEQLGTAASGTWQAAWTVLLAAMAEEAQTIKGCLVGVTPDFTESGDTNSQVSRYDLLYGIAYDVLDATEKLYINIVDDGLGYYHLDLFDASTRAVGDLIGHSATYDSTGLVTISMDNDSGIGGQLNIDAVTAVSTSIVVTYSFAGVRTGTGTIESWKATQMALDEDDIRIVCDGGTAGAEYWTIYSSKYGTISTRAQTGVAFPASSTVDVLGFEFTITQDSHTDFAEDDEFRVTLRSDDGGIFQRYFRDSFKKVLPFEWDGTETISDTLAQ